MKEFKIYVVNEAQLFDYVEKNRSKLRYERVMTKISLIRIRIHIVLLKGSYNLYKKFLRSTKTIAKWF